MKMKKASEINKVAFIKNNKAAWRYIKAIDFSGVEDKLKTSHPKWSKKHISLAILSYQMFLYIARVFPTWSHAPHRSMDEVWHNHILYTKQYTQDCQALFGHYMHHNPASPRTKRGKKEKESLRDSYLNTRRQMVLTFGPKADPELLFKPVAKELKH